MSNYPRASRENVAYQRDAAYAVAPVQAPQPKLRAVKTARRRRSVIRPQYLLYMVAIIAVAGALLYSYTQMTTLTHQISQGENRLEELGNEYISLTSRQERSLGLPHVEEYAQQQLGMVKMDSTQVEYIEMNNPDEIEIGQAGGSLRGTVSKLVKSFSAILEYLE